MVGQFADRLLCARRPGLEKLLSRAEDGDQVFCTKLDRLGRNTLDMIQIVEGLHQKGVAVTFIDDNLSTAGDIGYMLITILSALAQAERARILERTNEGREAAMEKGIQFGRKPHKVLLSVIRPPRYPYL